MGRVACGNWVKKLQVKAWVVIGLPPYLAKITYVTKSWRLAIIMATSPSRQIIEVGKVGEKGLFDTFVK